MIQVYCEKGWKKRNEEKIRRFKTNNRLVTAELPLLATGLAYKTATVKADTTANDQAAKTATATDETPTSKKTSDEITAAFQTGDETGLKYESVKVKKIAGMTKDIIRGGDISTYQSLINAAPQAKIALQLETPNIYKYRTIMTVFKNNGINYDYLGTSYYPFWSTGNSNGTCKGQDLGKGAKYGDPIKVNISAALKWVKNL